MKIKEILLPEMTMKTGSMESLSIFFENALKERDSYTHIGDIESIRVLKKNDIYLLIDNNDIGIGFFQVYDNNKVATINVLFVDKPFRKTGIFTKFLWFLKRNEQYNQIKIGDTHSQDTVEVIKHLSKRFNIFWIKDNEKIPYDIATIDRFYSTMNPTGWEIVLENDYDFSSWPKFYEVPNVKCLYEWLFD